jgi:hypothetical protein
MNYEQIMAIFRTLLQMGGAVLAARGVMSADMVSTLSESVQVLIGAGVSIATIVWGVWARSDHNLVKSAVEVAERKPEVVRQVPKASKFT